MNPALVVMGGGGGDMNVIDSNSLPCFSTDTDYENANRTADGDVELMAFQSLIGEDYKGHDLSFL